MHAIQQARVNASLQQIMDMLILLNTRTTFGRVIDMLLALDVPINLPTYRVVSDADSDSDASDGKASLSDVPASMATSNGHLNRSVSDETDGSDDNMCTNRGSDANDDSRSELSYIDPDSPSPATASGFPLDPEDDVPDTSITTAETISATDTSAVCLDSPRYMFGTFEDGLGLDIPIGIGNRLQLRHPLASMASSPLNGLAFVAGDLDVEDPKNLVRPYSAISSSDDASQDDSKRRRLLPPVRSREESGMWYCITRGRKAGVVFGRAQVEVLTKCIDEAVYFPKDTRIQAEQLFLNEWLSGHVYSADGDFVGVGYL